MRKRFGGMGLVVLGAMISLVGCGSPMQEEDTEPLDGIEAQQERAPGSDSVLLDEQMQSTPPEEGVAAARDCVYVNWCNEPGPRGTVCVLRKGCSRNNATINECIEDARAVCGRIIQPFYMEN